MPGVLGEKGIFPVYKTNCVILNREEAGIGEHTVTRKMPEKSTFI